VSNSSRTIVSVSSVKDIGMADVRSGTAQKSFVVAALELRRNAQHRQKIVLRRAVNVVGNAFLVKLQLVG
jgi:hypothetical protein